LESVEHLKQIEPHSTPNLSNDKEVSTEAHSFITIPLVTLHEPQALVLQCLKELSYAKTLMDLCTQGHKSRNHLPKKIIQSKQVGYLRRRTFFQRAIKFERRNGGRDWLDIQMIGEGTVKFLFHFTFHTFDFFPFSSYFLSFYFCY
jgi:hypothetical protein